MRYRAHPRAAPTSRRCCASSQPRCDEEIDYVAEAQQRRDLPRELRRRPGVQVPRVVWTLSTRRVLTLEDVSAIKITDYAAITAAGIDRAEVAAAPRSHVYLKQIFEDGFFHADPHPGNLFVTPVPASEEHAAAGG